MHSGKIYSSQVKVKMSSLGCYANNTVAMQTTRLLCKQLGGYVNNSVAMQTTLVVMASLSVAKCVYYCVTLVAKEITLVTRLLGH